MTLSRAGGPNATATSSLSTRRSLAFAYSWPELRRRLAGCAWGVEPPTNGPSSAKSFLEPRVVAYGDEVVVRARLLAEPREQLGGALEVAERLVAGVAGERCEARVVVMEARVVRRALEAMADRFERVAVALLAVGGHRLVMERPRVTPVDPLVCLAGCRAEC